MQRIDLTPSAYVQRAKTRLALQRWTAPVALCAVIALVPIGFEHTQAPDPSGRLAEERMLQAESRLSRSESAIQQASAQLAQHERELMAEQHLTRRPDWSAVMTLIARQFDAQTMMTGFQLGDLQTSGVRSALGPLGADAPDESVWLVLTGVAESNSDVPGLILRLERLGIFERVVMTGTQRELFAGASRTAFTLACRVQ